MTWTKERVQRLTAMWSDGNSASIIASALGGGITRNAVMGKIFRLDLPTRKGTIIRARKPRHHRPARRLVAEYVSPRRLARGYARERTKSEIQAEFVKAWLNTAATQSAMRQ